MVRLAIRADNPGNCRMRPGDGGNRNSFVMLARLFQHSEDRWAPERSRACITGLPASHFNARLSSRIVTEPMSSLNRPFKYAVRSLRRPGVLRVDTFCALTVLTSGISRWRTFYAQRQAYEREPPASGSPGRAPPHQDHPALGA